MAIKRAAENKLNVFADSKALGLVRRSNTERPWLYGALGAQYIFLDIHVCQ